MKEEALKEGKVLRYAGVVDVEKGEIRASLEKYVPAMYEPTCY